MNPLRRPSAADNDVSLDQPSTSAGGKVKRARAHLSCEECRRTKSKCDRSWPCSECVRKDVAHLCPNGAVVNGPTKTQRIKALQARVVVLENELRRVGANVPPARGSTSTEPAKADTSELAPLQPTVDPIEPLQMTAMLDHIALGQSDKRRYIGTEASPFYLESAAESEDERTPTTNRLWAPVPQDPALQVPWANHAKDGSMDLAGPLLDKCRALLPSRNDAAAAFEQYWPLLTWRTQPMTRAYFLSHVLSAVYDSRDGPHPHDLAVLFSVLALAYLFGDATSDPTTSLRSNSTEKARECHSTAYACLVAGRMFTNVTTSCLIALQNIGTFMLNSDDRRLPDGNFAVFGLAMRLAIIGGYHRDPQHLREMPLEEMDMRRRVFHEILASDRLHSLPALLPNSIDTSHYDCKLPSDVPPNGYFVFKWRIGVYISRVVDYWTSTTIPPYQVLQDIDRSIRTLLHSLPSSLRCPYLPANAFSLSSLPSTHALDPGAEQAEAMQDTALMAKQQIRLAMHFCMLLFYLHRPHFMRSLASDDTSASLSVEAVVEACEHVASLTEAVMNMNWELSRWFSFAGDLFSVLHCQTVLVVKTTDVSQLPVRMAVLERGVETPRRTANFRPSSKNRAILQGATKLLANAKQSRTSTQGLSPLWQEWLAWSDSTVTSNHAPMDTVSPWLVGGANAWNMSPSGFEEDNIGSDPFFASLLQLTEQLPAQAESGAGDAPFA